VRNPLVSHHTDACARVSLVASIDLVNDLKSVALIQHDHLASERLSGIHHCSSAVVSLELDEGGINAPIISADPLSLRTPVGAIVVASSRTLTAKADYFCIVNSSARTSGIGDLRDTRDNAG